MSHVETTVRRHPFGGQFGRRTILGGLSALVWICVFLGATVLQAAAGPYAPAAGQSGSTAIYMNSASFVAWATGYVNYIPGTYVDAEWQTPAKALGKAVGDSYDICCLGRGGQITMTFAQPIGNGSGWDFAVFENSFDDGFLELAYVEVSSDGVTFKRFYNRSLTANPVATYGTVDPTDVYGLAGKYRQGYGVPFDLNDVGLSSVTHVRIVDVVGNGSYHDTVGGVIYDPYPTWGSAGFDLDAVGVIHRYSPSIPPTVTTSAASGITQNQALLNGTVNPNGSATTYYFQYGRTTAYGSTTSVGSAGSGSSAVSVNAWIGGLGAGYTYHFRLVAQNVGGTSTGAHRSFKTVGSNTVYVIPSGQTGNCGGLTPCCTSMGEAVDYAMNTSPGDEVSIKMAAGTYYEGIDASNPSEKQLP